MQKDLNAEYDGNPGDRYHRFHINDFSMIYNLRFPLNYNFTAIMGFNKKEFNDKTLSLIKQIYCFIVLCSC